jgi:hypothetical protein
MSALLTATSCRSQVHERDRKYLCTCCTFVPTLPVQPQRRRSSTNNSKPQASVCGSFQLSRNDLTLSSRLPNFRIFNIKAQAHHVLVVAKCLNVATDTISTQPEFHHHALTPPLLTRLPSQKHYRHLVRGLKDAPQVLELQISACLVHLVERRPQWARTNQAWPPHLWALPQPRRVEQILLGRRLKSRG